MSMDPFEEKLDTKRKHLAALLNRRRARTIRNFYFSCTALTYMILKADLDLANEQLFKILGLDYESDDDNIFVSAIVIHIGCIAQQLYDHFGAPNLDFIPLTDLKDISYEIALVFKQIFFVPRFTTCLEEIENWEEFASEAQFRTCSVIQYISKFNEMWIVTYLLKREYKTVFVNSKDGDS